MTCTCSSQDLQCLLPESAGCCHVSISGASKSINFYGFHSVILFFLVFKDTLWSVLPALSTPLKKPNNQIFHLPKKTQPPQNQKTPLHLHLSNHVWFVGMFLTAITETLESAPEQQKSSLWLPDQIKSVFISFPW